MGDRQVCGGQGDWDDGARLALDALAMKPTRGIPQWMIHLMEIPELEYFAGRAPGDDRRDVEGVYLGFQRRLGACLVDQDIPDNPLSMNSDGCDPHTGRGATTGAEMIVVDGMRIDGPEDVVAHLEQFEFPRLKQAIASDGPDEPARVAALIERERSIQQRFGPSIVKVPYDGFFAFPYLRYGTYGYASYFMAVALYRR
jgi:hypothetical protein